MAPTALMFEGIVLGLAPVTKVESGTGITRLKIDLAGLVEDVDDGGSIAINGTCLTSVGHDGSIYSFDVIQESLDKTNLSQLKDGSRVNVELPLKWGGEINGHLVQGHIDATATVVERQEREGDVRITFDLAAAHHQFLVEKGSIAIDGISLTLVDVDQEKSQFSVALIPFTLDITTLGFRQPGEQVNIEVDQQAKLIHHYLGSWKAKVEDELRLLREKVGV